MAYRIFDADGNLTGGDPLLDDWMKGAAEAEDGFVLDDADRVVFESVAHRNRAV